MSKTRSASRVLTGALLALAWCFAAPALGGWLEAVKPPYPAPPLELADAHGGRHSLAGLSGKVVLVNFWATWCAPCREEMPSILRLRRQIGDARLAVLGVNVEEPLGRVRLWERRLGLNFPTLLDDRGQARHDWLVKVYPSSFLVDAEGQVRFRALGPIDWNGEEARRALGGLLLEIPPKPDVRRTQLGGTAALRLAKGDRSDPVTAWTWGHESARGLKRQAPATDTLAKAGRRAGR
jgi:thiol-disulfide isomerase/thioredoxin